MFYKEKKRNIMTETLNCMANLTHQQFSLRTILEQFSIQMNWIHWSISLRDYISFATNILKETAWNLIYEYIRILQYILKLLVKVRESWWFGLNIEKGYDVT